MKRRNNRSTPFNQISLTKMGTPKHPHFLNFSLEITQWIVYNQSRNNQRIFAVSDDSYRKLINRVYELHRLSPSDVGGSRLTFCGDCQDMIKLQKWLTATSKFLTYSYVIPFRSRIIQSPDYPYVVLIWSKIL